MTYYLNDRLFLTGYSAVVLVDLAIHVSSVDQFVTVIIFFLVRIIDIHIYLLIYEMSFQHLFDATLSLSIFILKENRLTFDDNICHIQRCRYRLE